MPPCFATRVAGRITVSEADWQRAARDGMRGLAGTQDRAICSPLHVTPVSRLYHIELGGEERGTSLPWNSCKSVCRIVSGVSS